MNKNSRRATYREVYTSKYLIFTLHVKYMIFDPGEALGERAVDFDLFLVAPRYFSRTSGKGRRFECRSFRILSRVGRKRRPLDDKVSYMFETLATLVCF